MQIAIEGKTSVEISDLNQIDSISADIESYDINSNEIFGNLLISGFCYKKDEKDKKSFEKLIPFNISCKEENIKIDDIDVTNFKYYEIVGYGIECEFKIVVEYDIFNNEIELEKDESLNNEDKLDYITENEIVDKSDNIIEKKQTEENESYELEKLKKEIEKKYDNILEDLLLSREEADMIVTEEKLENNLCINNMVKIDDKVDFRNIKDVYSSYKVYYIKDESRIDEVCKKENLSIEEVFKNNSKYEENKKIIIK